MALSAGLVGLPNVGKSTLFNALTGSSVPAQNYPFCTIEPHVAITAVPDERIERLQKIYTSKKTIPALFQFVDIAGLVKGAAAGEGLGNKFLANIKEVDLILHVVRCFEDAAITNTQTALNPLADFDTILVELMLKDIESVQKRQQKLEQLCKAAKQKPAELKELMAEVALLTQLEAALQKEDAEQVRTLIAAAEVKTIELLAAKKFLIIANISEQEREAEAYQENKHYKALVNRFGQDKIVPICAQLEYELTKLSPEEAQDMLALLGITQSGLGTIIEKSYHAVDLITFFTCGPQEIHAWPLQRGTSIRTAGGKIHSDLERGFICADIFNCQELFVAQTEAKLKERGKIRVEGQDYQVQDGDIVHIKFNV